jgi:hypothetical protein
VGGGERSLLMLGRKCPYSLFGCPLLQFGSHV